MVCVESVLASACATSTAPLIIIVPFAHVALIPPPSLSPLLQYSTWRWNYSIFLWVWAGVFALLEVVSWLLWLKNRKAGQEEQVALKTVEP